MRPEHAPTSSERSHEQAEHITHPDKTAERRERLQEEGERAASKQEEQVESARTRIDKMPEAPEASSESKKDAPYTPFERSHVKRSTYKQTLKDIQQQLPARRSKAFSRFIHKPSVESVSEVAAKTVFRPSVTLGASLGALLGGSLIYFIARHYGFRISGSEFLLFGAIGAVAGIAFEFLSLLLKKLFRRTSER